MKVKFCITVKVIEIHILAINKYKKLHFLRCLKKKKNLMQPAFCVRVRGVYV